MIINDYFIDNTIFFIVELGVELFFFKNKPFKYTKLY